MIDLIMLNNIKNKILENKDICSNEAQTRSWFIEPFLMLLGFDSRNPKDVLSEFTSDVGNKKGEKVDYALLKDGHIFCLVESKHISKNLDNTHVNQLFRYYTTSTAKLGILTNGIEYLFFSDTVKQNIMDDEPFFKFNITEFTERDVLVLESFCKDNINNVSVNNMAELIKFENAFERYIENLKVCVDAEFAKFILKKLDSKYLNISDASYVMYNVLNRMINSYSTDTDDNIDKLNIISKDVEATEKKEDDNQETSSEIIGDNKKVRYSDEIHEITMRELYELKSSEFNTGSKIVSVCVFGDYHDEKVSWTFLLTETIGKILDMNIISLEELDKLDEIVGDKADWISSKHEDMKNPKQIRDTGIFVETYASSQILYRRVCKILNNFGYLDDVTVKLVYRL